MAASSRIETLSAILQGRDGGENAGQVDMGWRGYFSGNALHITKEDRAALTSR